MPSGYPKNGINKGWFKKGSHPSVSTEFKTGQVFSKERNEKVSRTMKGKRPYWLDNQKGSNHPNWKGGITRDKHANSQVKKWRQSVFKRDNYTCQNCGKRSGNGEKVYLEAHHILAWCNYPELRFELSNGMTLCKECHVVETRKYQKINWKNQYVKSI